MKPDLSDLLIALGFFLALAGLVLIHWTLGLVWVGIILMRIGLARGV